MISHFYKKKTSQPKLDMSMNQFISFEKHCRACHIFIILFKVFFTSVDLISSLMILFNTRIISNNVKKKTLSFDMNGNADHKTLSLKYFLKINEDLSLIINHNYNYFHFRQPWACLHI